MNIFEHVKCYPDDKPSQGTLASSQGVCVDVYVVSSEWVDLASIRSVCELTGGRLVHYNDPVECSLPKDWLVALCLDFNLSLAHVTTF